MGWIANGGNMARELTPAVAQQALDKILDYGIGGVGPLKSATDLANDYMADHRYPSNDARIDSLVKWEMSKNFTTGFVTGLGGIATLPAAIPASLGSALIIQARMVAAIAVINGYDPSDDRVRTMVGISLIGDAGKEVIKRSGIELSRRAGNAAVAKIPGRVLIDINKRVGFRLLTKAGSRGIVNFTRVVPVLGGVVGGSVDAVACRSIAAAARRNFPATRGVPSEPVSSVAA